MKKCLNCPNLMPSDKKKTLCKICFIKEKAFDIKDPYLEMDKCADCRKKIKSPSYLCNDCDAKHRESVFIDATIAQLERENKGSNTYRNIRHWAKKVVQDRPKVCFRCGYDKHVENHHIKPISEFPKDTLMSVVNAEDNLVLACPNCHWELHDERSKEIKRQKLKSKPKYQPKTKIDWPKTDILIRMIKNSSVLETSRQLGVSDNAITKRLKKLKLEWR